MKLNEWGNLIVSWANFLDPNEEIGSLEDLSKSDLFNRLLGVLRDPFEQCSDEKKELCTFLQEQYPSLELGEINAENKHGTILRATAFLIYCSLHHEENELQKKMTELPGWTQLCLTDFLQEFVDVRKSDITQALIFTEISKIHSSRIPENERNSPSFGTPVMYTSSPSTEGSKTLSSSKKTSKVRRLRKEIEILNTMKSELNEELEDAKECISRLESTIHKKDQDINKLKMELKKVSDKEHVCEVPASHVTENTKNNKLKILIEKLEEEKSALEFELQTARDEKNNTYDELQRAKNVIQMAEIQKQISENEKTDLESQINNLKIALEQLTITNKEQAEYINELTRSKDDSKTFSDSLSGSLILPESLGQHVIDLEINELKDIIESKESLIKTLESEVQEKHSANENLKLNLTEMERKYAKLLEDYSLREQTLLKEIEFKANENINLKTLEKEMIEQYNELTNKFEDLRNSLSSKEDIICQMMLENSELENNIKNIQNEFQSQLNHKECFISDLESQIGKLTDQISSLTDETERLKTELLQSNNNLEKVNFEFTQHRQQFSEFSEMKENEINNKNKNINELKENINSINAKLSESIEQYVSLQSKTDSEIAKLLNELKLSNDREALISNSLSALKKELSEEINVKETIIIDLRSNLMSNLERNKTYENEILSLKELIKSKEIALSNTESDLRHNKEQLRQIEESLEAQFKCNKELESVLEGMRSKLMDESMKHQEEIHELNDKISNLVSASEEKDSVIVSLQSSLDSLHEEIRILKANQSSLSGELQSKISCIEGLNKEILDLNSIVSEYHNEKQAFLRTISEKNEAYEEIISNFEKMKVDLSSKIHSLQEQLNTKIEACRVIEDEKLIMKQDLDSSKKSISVLENILKEKEEEIISKTNIIEKLMTDIKNYQFQECDLSVKLHDCHEKINKLNDDLISKNSMILVKDNQIESLRTQYSSVIAEKHHLDELVNNNVELIKALELKLNDKEQQISETEEQKNRELSEFNIIIEELKCSSAESDLQLTELRKQKEHLNAELAEKTALINDYEGKLKLIENKSQSIKEENQCLLKKLISSEKCTVELECKIKNFETKLLELMNDNSNKDIEIETFKEKCDFQADNIIQLQKDVSENIEKQSLLSDELKEKLATIDSLQETLKQLQESLKVKENQYTDLEKESFILKDTTSNYENKVKHLETILVENKSSLEKQEVYICELSKEVKRLQNLEFSLKEDLLKKEKEFSEIVYENNSLKEELKNKQSELDRLIKDNESKSQEIQEHLCSIKTLQNNSSEKILDLNEEIKRYKTTLDDIVAEKECLKSEFEHLKTENECLNSKLVTLEKEHHGCGEKAQCAESVIHELKDKERILKEELYKSNKREVSLEREVSNKSNCLSSLQEEVKNLKKTLEDQEFKGGIVFTKLQAKEAEVNQLILELNEIKNKLKAAEERHQEETTLHLQKITDLDATIGLLNNQFIKINIEKESLITDLENKRATEKELKLLQTEFESLKDKNYCLEKEVVLKNNEISELEEICLSLQNNSQKLEKEKSELVDAFEKQTKELNCLKEKIVELQDSISLSNNRETDLLNEISSKNTLIYTLENKITDSIKINDELNSELRSLKDAISNKDIMLEKYAKEKNVLMLDLDLHVKKEEILNSQLESKIKELEDLRSLYKELEVETSKLKLKCSDQDQTIRGLYATLHSQNDELKEKETEVAMLEQGIKNVNQQLLEEKKIKPKDPRPITEGEEASALALKTVPGKLLTEEEVNARVKEMKQSYEKKVEAYKGIMKKRFAEKLEDLTYTLQNENTDLKEKLLKEQERTAKLQSELWNASDKLLITQEQNRTLMSKIQTRNVFEVVRPTETLSPISKARSLEVLSGRNRGIDNFARDISFNESACSSRRSSIRSLPRGIGKKFSFSAGKVFPAAEEDGEMFDNRYLADLKAGICNLPYDPDRMSTLQYRNSLCPPHLKSSYPVETHFIPCDLKEDEIKSGSRPTGSHSESDVRKTKIQSTYKKPGPPTPKKNGGHSSSQSGSHLTGSHSESDVRKTKIQGNEMKCPMTPKNPQKHNPREGVVNESFVLRDGNARPSEIPQQRTFKPSTPSRLKALFTGRKDENTPRRKSMFQKKN